MRRLLTLVAGLAVGAGLLVVAPSPALAICNGDPEVSCVTPHKAVKLWNKGHYKHADGVPWKRLTAHPAKIRAAFVKRFERYYDNASTLKKAAIRKRYHIPTTHNGKVLARGTGDGCHLSWTVAFCAAKNIVGSLNHVSCSTTPDGVPSTDDSDCITFTGMLGLGHGNGLSKDDVQNAGTVGWCAGNAYIGVRAAAESPGPFSPYFMAGWGAGNCLWAGWIAFDH